MQRGLEGATALDLINMVPPYLDQHACRCLSKRPAALRGGRWPRGAHGVGRAENGQT